VVPESDNGTVQMYVHGGRENFIYLENALHAQCWWYRKYASQDTTLERLEVEAREAKKGLWADPQLM